MSFSSKCFSDSGIRWLEARQDRTRLQALHLAGAGGARNGREEEKTPHPPAHLLSPCCGMPGARCPLCPLALQLGPRTPKDGRQVAQLVHEEPLPRKGLPPPGGRPPSGTQAPEENPARSPREPQEARPGRQEGGTPPLRPTPRKRLQRCTEPRWGPIPGPPATLLSQDGAQVAAPAARVWGTDPGQVAPALPRVNSDTGARRQGQMSIFLRVPRPTASPGAGRTVGRSAELPRPLRAASEFPFAKCGQRWAPHSHLSPLLLFPATGTRRVRSQGLPPGKHTVGSLPAGPSRGALPRWGVGTGVRPEA